MMKLPAIVAFICAVIALMGCANVPGPTCTLPGQVAPQLVSPVNGATGVPVSIGTLIATTAFLPNAITLFPVSGASIALGSFKPIGTTSNSSIAVPTLLPATKYTLTVSDLFQGCGGPNPPPPLTIIGTFTTQ